MASSREAAGSRACSGIPTVESARRPRAARPAGARRVRLISIAHHLGQPARSTAGRGREATPRTGARAGNPTRGRRCLPHGTRLARAVVTHRPRGGWPLTCPWMKEQSSGLGDKGQPTWTNQVPILCSILSNPGPGELATALSGCLALSPCGCLRF